MFSLDQQESPLAFIVLSSVGGSIIGPIIGGFVEENLEWTWTIWIQLIFGVFAQLLHFRFVPETRSSILLDKHASWLRKMKINPLALGPNEHKSMKDYLAPRDLLSLWARPFKMFAKERIVLVLSLLSGFSDALIFMQIQSFARVFKLWDFSTVQIGLVSHHTACPNHDITSMLIPPTGFYIHWHCIHRCILAFHSCHPSEPSFQAEEPSLRTRPVRVTIVVVAIYCSASPYWIADIRLDEHTRCTLDCPDGWLRIHRYCELFHLHDFDRLHGSCLRSLLSICHRRQRVCSRSLGWTPHVGCGALLRFF